MEREGFPHRAVAAVLLRLLLCLLALPALAAPARIKDGLIAREAVRHDPDGPDQIIWATAENPSLRFLYLRLCMKADDVASATVRIYKISSDGYEMSRDQPLEPCARTGPLEYRSLTIPFDDEPTAGPTRSRWRGYRFQLDDDDDVLWVGRDSLSTHEEQVPRFETLFRPQSARQISGTIDPSMAGVSDRVLSIPAWVQDAVFYQVLPDRFRNGDPANDPAGTVAWGSEPSSETNFFGGDLRGLLEALPYLDSLGVNALCLSPVFAGSGNRKVDASDYSRIDPQFGDEALLRELVQAAHARGMHVLLDGVFDHVGSDHPYFKDAVEFGPQSDFWAWFRFRGFPVLRTPTPGYDCVGGDAARPKWNLDDAELRDYILGIARTWTDLGIDGWRVEAPEEIPPDFWVQFREAVKAMNPTAYILGEVRGSGRSWLQGDQFDAVTAHRFRDACLAFFADTTGDARTLDEALARIRVDTPDPMNRIAFNLLGSHDTARLMTALRGDERLVRLAVLLQMTYPGAPAVYYGDEVGLTGDKDPDCRGAFPWRRPEQNAPLREHYRLLLKIRREHAALRRGAFLPLAAEGGRYVFLRRASDEVLMVVINRSPEPFSCKLEVPKGVSAVQQKDAMDLLSGARHPVRSGVVTVKEVPPWSGAILKLR